MKTSPLEKLRQRIYGFLYEDIWEPKLSDLGRLKRFLFHQLRVLAMVARGFVRDKCALRASGLAYITLLSLIPFLAAVFLLVNSFGGLKTLADDQLKPMVYKFLIFDVPAGDEEETDPTPPADNGLDEKRKQISDKLDEFLEGIRSKPASAVAIFFMLLTAVGLLTNIEKSFNDIWGIKRGRSWFSRFTLYCTTILIGPILLLAALGLTANFQSLALVESLHVDQSLFQTLVPVILSCVALAFLYLYMPNTRVRFVPGLVAGLVAGILLHVAMWGYVVYVASAVKWDYLYGTLGAIPILLVWIYVIWVIVLFGAELAFATQHAGTYRMEEESLSASPHFREILSLALLTDIGRRYLEGDPPESAQGIAAELNMPVRLVQDILFLFTRYGILVEAAGTEKNPGYVPGRPMDRIRAQEVVDVVRHHSPVRLGLPAGEGTEAAITLVEDADRARGTVFGETTLADLVSGGTPVPPPVWETPEEEPAPMEDWGEEEPGEDTQPVVIPKDEEDPPPEEPPEEPESPPEDAKS